MWSIVTIYQDSVIFVKHWLKEIKEKRRDGTMRICSFPPLFRPFLSSRCDLRSQLCSLVSEAVIPQLGRGDCAFEYFSALGTETVHPGVCPPSHFSGKRPHAQPERSAVRYHRSLFLFICLCLRRPTPPLPLSSLDGWEAEMFESLVRS